MKPCAHCGNWTCSCGQPAVALVATRECGGTLGRGNRMTGPPDAFCQHCLEGIARVHGDGLDSIGHLITWITPQTAKEGNMTNLDLSQSDLPFDPATAPLEAVWDWLCERVPGLRESPGLGVPPNDKAGPLTYCEASLYHLIGEAVAARPVWSTCSLSEYPELGICQVQVDIFAGYAAPSGIALSGQGTAHCDWGDADRQPAKEARLRAAADLLLKAKEEKP